ncbi:dihydrofolate reductase [Mycoplasma miroungirhinis]|uniref:dihydrofolate reductase n=1 Tax=Mycoplasma miroungirhinis TaxID=754516 RepID=A0A6M4JIM2_9MOLU|nr:dihydrofolate reductase [Mycoplasma miroungirhinis]QJR44331.1 dihydrofolate reductase [Mycoplasma miroungirhinis]
MIKLIVAMDKNNLIGNGTRLPWKIAEELKHFKEKTLNHALIFGKNTYLSLPKLPSRKIFVLSETDIEGVYKTIKNEQQLLELFKEYKDSEDVLFIAGGKFVYEHYFSYADELIISRIKDTYEGDVYLNLSTENYKHIKDEEHEKFIVEYWKK